MVTKHSGYRLYCPVNCIVFSSAGRLYSPWAPFVTDCLCSGVFVLLCAAVLGVEEKEEKRTLLELGEKAGKHTVISVMSCSNDIFLLHFLHLERIMIKTEARGEQSSTYCVALHLMAALS